MIDKKTEAIERMHQIGIYAQTIRQFERENIVSVSEPPLGACYWINDVQKKRIADFEERYNALVYHVIHSYTSMGELETYFYVNDHPEEWELDRYDISKKKGALLCLQFNRSEFKRGRNNRIPTHTGPRITADMVREARKMNNDRQAAEALHTLPDAIKEQPKQCTPNTKYCI